MNGNTALIILNIAIIGIIAIIIVKLYYRDDSKDKEISSLSDLRPSFLDKDKGQIESSSRFSESSIARETAPVKPRAPSRQRVQAQSRRSPSRNRPPAHERLSQDMRRSQAAAVVSTRDPERVRRQQQSPKPTREAPKVVAEKPVSVIKKENEIYDVNEAKVLQEKEPQTIKEPVAEPKVEKTEELKDLFTIDELIKESKRKDNERLQKASVTEEEVTEEPAVETPVKEETPEAETVPEVETVEEATPVVEEVVDEIDEEPIIKPLDEEITPDEFEIDETKFVPEEIPEAPKRAKEEEYSDLDYRKDLEKIKNVVKSSKLFSDIKSKIAPDVNANAEYGSNDNFRRSVGDFEGNEYENSQYYDDFDADDWEPIIPEPQPDYSFVEREYHPLSASEQLDEDLRLENTRKVFNMAKQPKASAELEKPVKKVQITSVTFTLNNEDVTLNKNDEIIYKIDGETYSSRVLAIQGDDIIVRYRGKNKTINIDAVKKIY